MTTRCHWSEGSSRTVAFRPRRSGSKNGSVSSSRTGCEGVARVADRARHARHRRLSDIKFRRSSRPCDAMDITLAAFGRAGRAARGMTQELGGNISAPYPDGGEWRPPSRSAAPRPRTGAASRSVEGDVVRRRRGELERLPVRHHADDCLRKPRRGRPRSGTSRRRPRPRRSPPRRSAPPASQSTRPRGR